LRLEAEARACGAGFQACRNLPINNRQECLCSTGKKMKSLQLFRLLQQHAGKINNLAVRLYKEDIEVKDAFEQALAEVERVYNIMAQPDMEA
jgi:hypothetical protein